MNKMVKEFANFAMKKALILIIMVLLLVGCRARARDFSQFYAGDNNNVTRLIMQDGNSGETREITNQEEIQAFFDMLETTAFMMLKDHSPRPGYLYWVDIYEDGQAVLTLTFGEESATINGVHYVLDNNVRAELSQLYNSGVRISSSGS
jgi:hypothetical protein